MTTLMEQTDPPMFGNHVVVPSIFNDVAHRVAVPPLGSGGIPSGSLSLVTPIPLLPG